MTAIVLRSARLGRQAAVLGLLLCAANAPSDAAIATFVDGAGACAGKTPCFTTIQAGVNNAGPPPAAVMVFPGTYAESVDLGLMGSAIGGSTGDLMLRTVDSAGHEVSGGVSVLPATGPAFGNSAAPFAGTIIIDGFTVKSKDTDGIALGQVMGSITMASVTSDANAGQGFTAAISGGGVSLIDSSFSNNLGGDGISFSTATGVGFEGVTVDGNSGGGASFAVASGVVSAVRSSFSRNKNGDGLSFATAVGVNLDHVTADENQNDGASFAVAGPVHIGQSSFSRATNGSGLSFATATDVTLEDVAADENQNTGASFALSGMLQISRSSFSRAKNGGGLSFATATDVSFDQVTADENQNDGADFGMTGVLRISNSSFSGAANGRGLDFGTASEVIFTRVFADGNQNDGALFSASGEVSIARSSFSNAKNGDGLSIPTVYQLVMMDDTVSGNSNDGLSAKLGGCRITGSKFEANGGNGILLTPNIIGEGFQLSCNDIVGNQVGLRVVANALINAANNFWGSPTGPTHPNNPGGTGDLIIDGANGGAGQVDFTPFLTEPEEFSPFCAKHGAPVMQAPGLALLALGLLILGATTRHSRRVNTKNTKSTKKI